MSLNNTQTLIIFFFFFFLVSAIRQPRLCNRNSIEHHRRKSGIQPHIDPVSSKMKHLNKEIRYSMEDGAF